MVARCDGAGAVTGGERMRAIAGQLSCAGLRSSSTDRSRCRRGLALRSFHPTDEAHVPRALTKAIREFAATLSGPYDREELLDQLVRQATELCGATGAGILLPDASGRLGFASSSDDRVRAVEEHQAAMNEGACYAAFSTEAIVAVSDLTRETRWPDYRAGCLHAGLVAVLGVPLAIPERTIGVMNVYREAPGPWTEEEIDACSTLAALSAACVLNATRQIAAEGVADQLQHALDARVDIEQAKGYLMASRRLSAEDALGLLRDEARRSNRKLRDLALEVLEHADGGAPTLLDAER
jgi:GAF domain-containing protein